ncbi:MAG: hypothetical protein HQL38_14405, partial [Alphaproteobacteria bacterium]|nr:hypothetical protein [Alphaproteobacteria bacterium]
MIPGPSRLILLNAGKYDFAEIDLATTIHLVGPNNVGKTTLVNALQFLYVDSTRHMEFGGRSQDETNRYYFHDPFSYILFECLTARGGFHMVGLRGLGPAHRFGFERFAFQGRFRREDFVGEDGLPLPPDQVRAGLAERGFTVLEPRNLVAALTGAADDKGVALGLLPLKGQGDYRRFRRIFGNLLRLSHLRQDDLKQLLLEVNEDAFSALEIDLGGRLAEDFVKASRQKAQLDEMARLEPQATRLVAALDEAAETRSRLVALWSRLRAGQAAEEKTAHREAARLREEGRLRQAEAVDLEARQRAQGEALTEMTGRLAIQESELAALDALERECGTLVAALQEALVHETEDRWSQLREALRGAERTGPDEIAAAATRVERRLDHTRRLLAAAGDNAAGWLRRRFGEDELARLFAVLDPALAGRALGEDVV